MVVFVLVSKKQRVKRHEPSNDRCECVCVWGKENVDIKKRNPDTNQRHIRKRTNAII